MKSKEQSDLFFANTQFVDGVGLDQLRIISTKTEEYYSDKFFDSMMQDCKLGILDEITKADLKKNIRNLIWNVKIIKEQAPQLKEVKSALKDLRDIEKSIDKCLRAKGTFEKLPRFVSQLVPKPSDWDRELFETASLEAVKEYVVKAIAALRIANIKRGRPLCWLEHFLVEGLINIYAKTWGKKPTMNIGSSTSKSISEGKPYGELYEFVKEIALPIFPDMSIESQLRDILYRKKSKRG